MYLKQLDNSESWGKFLKSNGKSAFKIVMYLKLESWKISLKTIKIGNLMSLLIAHFSTMNEVLFKSKVLYHRIENMYLKKGNLSIQKFDVGEEFENI